MRSPQIVYNVATGTFEAEFDEDGLDTFFVFPPDMEDGDNLPSIIIRLEGEEEPFQFDGKYNKDSRNMVRRFCSTNTPIGIFSRD